MTLGVIADTHGNLAGWRAAWDPRKGRHYFYARSDRSRVTWAVPTEPAPP